MRNFTATRLYVKTFYFNQVTIHDLNDGIAEMKTILMLFYFVQYGISRLNHFLFIQQIVVLCKIVDIDIWQPKMGL